jgi:hypothetical protein
MVIFSRPAGILFVPLSLLKLAYGGGLSSDR